MEVNDSQVIRVLFNPTLELTSLSVSASSEGTPNSDSGLKDANIAGDLFPVVNINKYNFRESEIEYFKIDCTGFLPELNIIVNVYNSTFISHNLPKDGDLVNVFIRSRNDVLKPIRNDYLITNVTTLNDASALNFKNIRLSITGVLYIPHIYDYRNLAINDTSFNVLKKVAKDLNLGFASNEASTNDKQTWICNGSYFNFIKEVGSSMWLNEKSFFKVFIDVYYNLNIVNVNKQIGGPVTIESGLLDVLRSNEFYSDVNKSQSAGPKVLNNLGEYSDTSFYIERYKITNQSSNISILLGYRYYLNFFDIETIKRQKIYLEPIITDGSENDKIILRGRPHDDSFKDQIRNNYIGIRYHNNYKNYYISKLYNIINNAELDKINLIVGVKRINLNIYRYERIPVIIFSGDDVLDNKDVGEAKEYQKVKEYNPEIGVYNKFYSGYYVVLGYNIIYRPSTVTSAPMFIQEFILSKREWELPI